MVLNTVSKDLPCWLERIIYFLEKGMVTHSSIHAWRTPWTEEPGRLQSMGSQRVGHDWAISHIIKNQKIGDNYGYLLLSSYCLSLCWSTLNVLFYLILSTTEEGNSVHFHFKEEENRFSNLLIVTGDRWFWWHHTERFVDWLLSKLRERGGHWE